MQGSQRQGRSTASFGGKDLEPFLHRFREIFADGGFQRDRGGLAARPSRREGGRTRSELGDGQQGTGGAVAVLQKLVSPGTCGEAVRASSLGGANPP